MTVIAFRPRPRTAAQSAADTPVPLAGTFWSPRGRLGHMVGALRVHRLVVVPRGTFVSGVFTGELRDGDGSLVGVDTRRATIAADLVREGAGYLPVLRPFQLDLMGITVDVEATKINPVRIPDSDPNPSRRSGRHTDHGPREVPS